MGGAISPRDDVVKCGPWLPKDCGFADVVTDHRFSHLEGLNAVPSLQYQSGRLPVVHSTTVRRPDKAWGRGRSTCLIVGP